MLIAMVLRNSNVPDEARTLARYNLRQLREEVDNTLKRRGRHLDTASKAHLEETRDRIAQTLEAQFQSR
jgi:hypothetical protein